MAVARLKPLEHIPLTYAHWVSVTPLKESSFIWKLLSGSYYWVGEK